MLPHGYHGCRGPGGRGSGVSTCLHVPPHATSDWCWRRRRWWCWRAPPRAGAAVRAVDHAAGSDQARVGSTVRRRCLPQRRGRGESIHESSARPLAAARRPPAPAIVAAAACVPSRSVFRARHRRVEVGALLCCALRCSAVHCAALLCTALLCTAREGVSVARPRSLRCRETTTTSTHNDHDHEHDHDPPPLRAAGGPEGGEGLHMTLIPLPLFTPNGRVLSLSASLSPPRRLCGIEGKAARPCCYRRGGHDRVLIRPHRASLLPERHPARHRGHPDPGLRL